jgi:hypothetical protein
MAETIIVGDGGTEMLSPIIREGNGGHHTEYGD